MNQTYMTHASQSSVGIANGSGWMTSADFITYMTHFIKHANAQKGSPTLLILDNHTSHLSIQAIDKAIKHDITMVSFPPHCTHRMQPLDVGVFGPVKTLYAIKHDDWKKSHMNVVFDLHYIPLIAEQCLDVCATPKNIKSAFKSTGIYPFDRNIFTEADFVGSKRIGTESGEEEEEDEDENPDNQRHLVVLTDADIATGAHEEVTTTSVRSDSIAFAADLREALKAVGPLKPGKPTTKSNRGRKPMTTSILTSPGNVASLRQKADTKRDKLKKQQQRKDAKETLPAPQKRKARKPSTASKKKQRAEEEEESVNPCIVCNGALPGRLSRNNSIRCNSCSKVAHLKCADMHASYFTCPGCESD